MQQFFTNNISVNFNLRQCRKNKPTIVYCVICFNGKQYKYNTLVKVLPKQWNRKKQQAIVSPHQSPQEIKNNIICNERLCFIKKQIEQILLSPLNSYTFVDNINNIISIVNPHHHSIVMAKKQTKKVNNTTQQTNSEPTTATEIIGNMLKNDQKISADTYKKVYSVYITTFETFLIKNRIKNELKSLKHNVLNEYALHLQKTQTSKYAKRVFNILRSWLKNKLPKYGVGYKYDEKIDLIKIDQTTITASEKGDEYIALTHEQIYKIYNLSDDELKNSTLKLDKLKFYKDMFVMQCMCGCRASDIVKLFDENNFNSNNGEPFIEFWAKKTERKEKVEKCVVPLTLYAEQLLLFERYKFIRMYESTFSGDSDNAYNKHIKEVCRIANFDDIVERTVELKGGKKKKEKKHLYERITSHVARHSFITNCVREFDLTSHEIIEMVGHSDTQYIDKVYLNLTTKDKAEKITKKINKNKQPQPIETTVIQPQQEPKEQIIKEYEEQKAKEEEIKRTKQTQKYALERATLEKEKYNALNKLLKSGIAYEEAITRIGNAFDRYLFFRQREREYKEKGETARATAYKKFYTNYINNIINGMSVEDAKRIGEKEYYSFIRKLETKK